MRDQASQLRNLVLRSLEQEAAGGESAPRLLLMTGGKGGVGTTTLAVNVSLAMALNGWRVVLVDADLYRADVAPLCGLAEQASVADILTARRDIHEVLQRGPAGLQIVPGLWAPGGATDFSEMRQQRLIQQLRSLRRYADLVVLDVGNGSTEIVRRFWRTADDIVVATTPDSVAVMDAYATIKTMTSQGDSPPIWLAVNQVPDSEVGQDVHRRIDQSCRRFLKLPVNFLGGICLDPAVPASADARRPLVMHVPDSVASQQIQAAAAAFCKRLEHPPNPGSAAAA